MAYLPNLYIAVIGLYQNWSKYSTQRKLKFVFRLKGFALMQSVSSIGLNDIRYVFFTR